VYKELASLSSFTNWAVWTQNDSSARYSLKGTDATVGSTTKWIGDPSISGEGEIKILALEENSKVMHEVLFTKPAKRTATSSFTIHEKGEFTTVTWKFEMRTPRPWNVFNLFYSMDKEKGAEFDKGLNALKNIIEKEEGSVSKNYEVHPFNFPSTRYAIIRENLREDQMSSFFQQHFPIIVDSAKHAGILPGTETGLFFVYSPGNIDVAAAIPIDHSAKLENSIISIFDIPSSKALYVDYSGPYGKISEAYNSLNKYLSENKLRSRSPSLELYSKGPFNEPDSSKWNTRIIYIIE